MSAPLSPPPLAPPPPAAKRLTLKSSMQNYLSKNIKPVALSEIVKTLKKVNRIEDRMKKRAALERTEKYVVVDKAGCVVREGLSVSSKTVKTLPEGQVVEVFLREVVGSVPATSVQLVDGGGWAFLASELGDRVLEPVATPVIHDMAQIDEAIVALKQGMAGLLPKKPKRRQVVAEGGAEEAVFDGVPETPQKGTSPSPRTNQRTMKKTPSRTLSSKLMLDNPPLSPEKTAKLDIMFTGVPSQSKRRTILSQIKSEDNDSTALLKSIIGDTHRHNMKYKRATNKSSKERRRYKDYIDDGMMRERAKSSAEREFALEEELLERERNAAQQC